jgi:hypothetical protein
LFQEMTCKLFFSSFLVFRCVSRWMLYFVKHKARLTIQGYEAKCCNINQNSDFFSFTRVSEVR